MNHSLPTSPEGLLIGGSVPDNPELSRKASPVYYATNKAVPVLIAHGDRDMLVPLNQSDLVAEALDRVNVEYEYYCLLGAGHGSREFWTDVMLDKVITFIQKYTVK
jgi:dipeptidyl aminopeptidase/acylaminoacyl peptidase